MPTVKTVEVNFTFVFVDKRRGLTAFAIVYYWCSQHHLFVSIAVTKCLMAH